MKNYGGSKMQGNDNNCTNDKSKCPDNFRFAGKDKYPGKVMILVITSNHGHFKAIISSIEDRGSKFQNLYKRILSKTIASFYP
jgi:hypothetical protein